MHMLYLDLSLVHSIVLSFKRCSTILFNFLTSFFNLTTSDMKNKTEIIIKDATSIKLGCISLLFSPLYHTNHILIKLETKKV